MHLVRVVSKRQREEKEMLRPGVQREQGPFSIPMGVGGDHPLIQKEGGILVRPWNSGSNPAVLWWAI